ncbi:unnamed protein product [Nippostrongylus brasiliensis]|uniref:General transcription factor IIH subunit 4 n=1 Tax=Nippostrongylus brasiliensis TaxID=27835 RepID=A0A0N4XXA8_NIPBR|nr:unnamed protein product [Nippostrongylus brasiliensis]
MAIVNYFSDVDVHSVNETGVEGEAPPFQPLQANFSAKKRWQWMQALNQNHFPTSPNMELTIDDLNTIRDHLQATGKLNESKKMSLTWLSDNISVLASLMPQSGSQLDHLLGKEYLFVKDALMYFPKPSSLTQALELLSIHGIITPKELAASDDSQVLYQAQPYDRLTFHSLGNVIRNIIRDRPED